MCLYVTHRQKNEWTAKRDITVWKLLLKDGRQSIFRSFLYKPNTAVHIEKMGRTEYDNGTRFAINEGFHAYRSMRGAMQGGVESDVIVKMTIPAGARYYIGMYDEIVSDTLVTGDMIPLRGNYGTS